MTCGEENSKQHLDFLLISLTEIVMDHIFDKVTFGPSHNLKIEINPKANRYYDKFSVTG